MKTILYLITQSELGGAQRYILDLAHSFQSEYKIIVAFGEQGEKGELVEKLKQSNIKYYIIPYLKRAISPLEDLQALWQIKKLIKKIKPDIIHLNSSKISILGSIAASLSKSQIKNRKLRIVYTAHGWVFNEPLPVWKKIFYKYAEKFTANFKDKIICVSEYDRQIALKEKIAPAKKLITIHNGIKPINFLLKKQAREKLKSYFPNTQRLIPNTHVIGSIGNLYKTKGYEYLIKATNILITNYQLPITTLIIGKGSAHKNLEKLIQQNHLEKNVILFGRINNAFELLPAFDIYINSSTKEGLSYTLIEAMQAGLPIVATNVGGNSELIINNKTGLLAEPKNSANLANKIKQLINNPNLSKKLSSLVKIKASEFNLQKMLRETKKIY